ncbi:MAG: PAS domain-containing protein [Acidobacteria bacterium]|nr:PAS domain-containing protein [Acidobacteriota bacterium]
MAKGEKRRAKVPWLLGTVVFVLLFVLVFLQSSNIWKSFTIETASDTVLLYFLSSLNFIAFMIFGGIFLRSLIKLMRERRMLELGAQIKTRLLMYFFLVSLLPILAMAMFSYLFMNRALERWFEQIPDNVVRQVRQMQDTTIQDRTEKLVESSNMLAAALNDRKLTNSDLGTIATAGGLTHIEVLAPDGKTINLFERDIPSDQKDDLERMLAVARETNASGRELVDGKGFDVGIASMSGGRRLLVVPDPVLETNVGQVVDNSVNEFERLKQQQATIRRVGLLTLGVLTFLLIFASSWIAFYIARGLTIPIKALAVGASEIAKGNLSHRVDVLAEDELAILVNTFNEMSATLESNSAELAKRRRYIETVLETLPTGVISFDSDNRVTTINPAASEMLGIDAEDNIGKKLDDLREFGEGTVLERLVARARRAGSAADQTVFGGANGSGSERTVAITAAALRDGSGVVLVLEDLSELIAAQRASAWQEVARRMAHEIKNPLTPIQLSAERIARRFELSGHKDRGNGKRIEDGGPIGDVVHESTDTIIREVSSLKSLVDEFSKFARLPEAHPEPGDLKAVIRQAVASFDGRFKDVTLEFHENGTLPEVMLDAEQIKRVYVNLIDNSVEAFDAGQADAKVTITARHDAARDIVVSEVADNGKGFARGDMQKLFQPYFSTKGRGTGLGLAIVNRIIAEHRGRINAVANQPRGAKFIIELPVGN